ncbi:Asp23/Gls24 family envelope stress response protein [Nocardioides aurantiacus]|uniref:Putative alkaline shock family protein YloU n=1 Tax=Nocardioides aurantiacus TaxID=86796 RepID=A0A3N2CXQ0_9ACTN|nr:Asp23/Gls24 family envelope stress response protein [Nocardioides aurantiacus]ROR92322.1 putative alkaline shock family protein YloU [Nocardioides aurantiacus]
MAEVETLPAPEERGRTVIADRVVERIASAAAGEVESTVDSRGGFGRLVRGRLPSAEAVVAGRTSRISVEVGAVWPASLSQLTARVRDHVGERVHTLTGVEVTAVDVTVADVVHSTAPSRRVL